MVLDQSGNRTQSQDYYAYGLTMPTRSYFGTTKEGFTGKETDIETGLQYFGARYYMPNLGRWMAIDPLAEKHPDWTPYNYVLANPLNLYDPDGRQERATTGRYTGPLYYESGGTMYMSLDERALLNGTMSVTEFRNRQVARGVGGFMGVGLVGGGLMLPEVGIWARSVWFAPSAGPMLQKGTEFAAEMICSGCSGKPITSAIASQADEVVETVVRNSDELGNNIALGVREYLDDFAKHTVKGSTWKVWGRENFETQFLETINNSSNKIHFNLDGIANPWSAISEGSRGLTQSRVTSWELFQIYSNPHVLQRTTFYRNGIIVPNPF